MKAHDCNCEYCARRSRPRTPTRPGVAALAKGWDAYLAYAVDLARVGAP